MRLLFKKINDELAMRGPISFKLDNIDVVALAYEHKFNNEISFEYVFSDLIKKSDIINGNYFLGEIPDHIYNENKRQLDGLEFLI